MLARSAIRPPQSLLGCLLRQALAVRVLSSTSCLAVPVRVTVAHPTLCARRGRELVVLHVTWWPGWNVAVKAVTEVAARSWRGEVAILG